MSISQLLPSGLSRRPAAVTDTDWARQVHHCALRQVVEAQFGGWDETEQDRFFDRDWLVEIFEVLEWWGQPCGYVCVEERSDDVHVRELVIAPEFQNQGIGSALVMDATRRAEERHVPVVLGTLHANRARVLYQRLGFEEVGTTATHTLYRLDPNAGGPHRGQASRRSPP